MGVAQQQQPDAGIPRQLTTSCPFVTRLCNKQAWPNSEFKTKVAVPQNVVSGVTVGACNDRGGPLFFSEITLLQELAKHVLTQKLIFRGKINLLYIADAKSHGLA